MIQGRLHALLLLTAAAVALPCAIARAETAATEIADEGVKDPSLVAVRQRLIRIFEAGDRSALAPHLHSGIVVGSGVIGPQHVGELDAKAGKEYADRLKAGGRFARPGLFFVFYDAQAQREADFRLDETNPEVHSLHGLAAVRLKPSDRARKINEFGEFAARLLPSPRRTPKDWVYVERADPTFDWNRGYVSKADLSTKNNDAVLILLKQRGRWWIVRMCLC